MKPSDIFVLALLILFLGAILWSSIFTVKLQQPDAQCVELGYDKATTTTLNPFTELEIACERTAIETVPLGELLR